MAPPGPPPGGLGPRGGEAFGFSPGSRAAARGAPDVLRGWAREAGRPSSDWPLGQPPGADSGDFLFEEDRPPPPADLPPPEPWLSAAQDRRAVASALAAGEVFEEDMEDMSAAGGQRSPPVKNTFIHFEDRLDSLLPSRKPWPSAPPVLMERTFRFRSMVKLAAATLEVSIQQVRDAASATLSGESVLPQREGALTVKNSFIHFDDEDEEWNLDDVRGKLTRQSSAPRKLMDGPFSLKHEATGQPRPEPDAKAEAHLRGECKPCAYFWDKEDGCRRGDACAFCHLCDETERKRRKKEKAKQQSIMKAMMKAACTGDNKKGLPISETGPP